jgi:hypothetical protein
MRTAQQSTAVFTLLCLSIAPLLPPAHLHRHTDPLGHAHTLVHRHFAPHAIAIGAHVAPHGAEGGAPTWLDDPGGVPANAPLVTTDAAIGTFFGLNPPPDVHHAAPPLDAPIHSPPHTPTGLRGPPPLSEPIDARLVDRSCAKENQMKRMISSVVAGLFLAVPALAAEQTWTGQISDSMCGAKHVSAEPGKKNVSDRECALACAEKGAQFVLVSGGRVYKLTNHDADLKVHADHTVSLTGDVTGETIRVTKIEMAKGAK